MVRSTKSLLAIVALGSLLLGSSGLAGATTATGSQNPRLTATASLLSDGPDPDRATIGDLVTASGSVENTTAQARTVTIVVTVIPPDGALTSSTERVSLAGHQTLERSFSYVVDSSIPAGVYRLRVVARTAGSASRAIARITIS